METSHISKRLVGYVVDNHHPHQSVLHGSALISGEKVEHLLSISSKPEMVCDVGRNTDGDLVWVSPHDPLANDPEPQLWSLFNSTTEVSYDPSETEMSHSSHDLTHSAEMVHSLWEKLKQHRSKALFAVGVTSVLLLGGFLLPTSGSSPSHAKNEVSSTPTSSSLRNVPAQNASEAAIDFVVEGKIPGITVPEGLSRDSLSATVVSTSGEIVLVDVQADHPEGLTTFATLLLQKSGTAWRIREVFDPR